MYVPAAHSMRKQAILVVCAYMLIKVKGIFVLGTKATLNIFIAVA